MPAIHPSAVVETDSVGAGATIGEFAVVRAGAVIGDGASDPPARVRRCRGRDRGRDRGPSRQLIGRAPRRRGGAREPPLRAAAGDRRRLRDRRQRGRLLRRRDRDRDAARRRGLDREPSRIGSGTVIGCEGHPRSRGDVGEGTRVMDKSYLTGEMKVGDRCFISAFVTSSNDNEFGRAGSRRRRSRRPGRRGRGDAGRGRGAASGRGHRRWRDRRCRRGGDQGRGAGRG